MEAVILQTGGKGYGLEFPKGNAGHLLVERRLDGDLFRELQSIPLTTSLQDDRFH
jgi:hypothetical protein